MAFDACPWGWGAVLTTHCVPTAWAAGTWDTTTLKRFDARTGDPAWQTFWEVLACLLTLEMWAPVETPFILWGDNIGALQNTASLKGRGALIAISQEIAWRQSARRWAAMPLHQPSELNTLADALSRLEAEGPERKVFPELLRGVARTQAPDPDELWSHFHMPTPRAQRKRKRPTPRRPRSPQDIV